MQTQADIVRSTRRFKEKLPELCALFRSKLFPDAGDTYTDSLLLSPPLSPKPAAKRLKSTSSATSTKVTTTTTSKAKGKGNAKGKDNRCRKEKNIVNGNISNWIVDPPKRKKSSERTSAKTSAMSTSVKTSPVSTSVR